jgi:hypothetical protein
VQKPFPLPYHENFEKLPLNRTPHYLSDQDGAFEVHRCGARAGQCLEQVITEKPIPWGPLPDPWTLAGDAHWADYEVNVDARLENAGDVTLMGRIDSADIFREKKAQYPSGYIFRIDREGSWELLSCAYKKPTVTLASGKQTPLADTWHHFRLVFRQRDIDIHLDGQTLATVQSSEHKAGMFGIGTGWNRVQFDELVVRAAKRK